MREQIYILESAVRSMPEHGDGKMNIIIDYQGWTLRNAPPLRTTKETISILQNQYPERLYKAYLYNPPGIFSVFFGMARPFLDPVTAAKINFIYSSNDKSLEILEANFDLDELERGVGGRSDEAYDHLVYSARMLGEERRRGVAPSEKLGEMAPADSGACEAESSDGKDAACTSSSRASGATDGGAAAAVNRRANGHRRPEDGPEGNGHRGPGTAPAAKPGGGRRGHSDVAVMLHLLTSSFVVTMFLSCLRLMFSYAAAANE